MSPSEHDLRAALRSGAGEGLDASAVLRHAHAAAARRRARTRSAALVTAAVAGVGGSLLWLGSGDHRDGSSSDNAAKAAAQGGAGSAYSVASPADHQQADNKISGTGTSAAARADGASNPSAGCPTSLPRLLLPGGGSAGRFGSAGPLFAGPASEVVVCAYPPTGGRPAGRAPVPVVLTAARAAALTAALEAASSAPAGCTDGVARRGVDGALAIYATTAAGRRLTVVTATVQDGCGQRVTNGTAIRYGWLPPLEVLDAVRTASA